MRRGLYKKDPRPRKHLRRGPPMRGVTPNYLRFNKDVNVLPPGGECRWISSLVGKVDQCNFILEAVDVFEIQDKKVVLVDIPEGTKLYHATFIPMGGDKWFETQMPFDSGKGIVWFASTPMHSSVINHTHILEYTVEEPLRMVFERNIAISYADKGVTKGYDYLPILAMTQIKLKELFGQKIDGYIGCNECEIGIFNDSIKEKLSKHSVFREKSLAYIE